MRSLHQERGTSSPRRPSAPLGQLAGMTTGRAAPTPGDQGGFPAAKASRHSPASPGDAARLSEIARDHGRGRAEPSSRGEQASRPDSSAPPSKPSRSERRNLIHPRAGATAQPSVTSGGAIACSASLPALRVSGPWLERAARVRRAGVRICAAPPSPEPAIVAPRRSSLRLTPTPGRLGGDRGEVSALSDTRRDS